MNKRSVTRNYRKFYVLLGQMCDVKDSLVSEFTDRLVLQFTDNRTTHLNEMKDLEYQAMLMAMEGVIASTKGHFADFDRWRKRVLAAVISMHQVHGIHPDNKVAYAKHTALRNMGCSDEYIKRMGAGALFNAITLNDLKAIYNWAIRTRRISENGDRFQDFIFQELSIKN